MAATGTRHFKDWRCIATRFDRNTKNFMGTISIGRSKGTNR